MTLEFHQVGTHHFSAPLQLWERFWKGSRCKSSLSSWVQCISRCHPCCSCLNCIDLLGVMNNELYIITYMMVMVVAYDKYRMHIMYFFYDPCMCIMLKEKHKSPGFHWKYCKFSARKHPPAFKERRMGNAMNDIVARINVIRSWHGKMGFLSIQKPRFLTGI